MEDHKNSQVQEAYYVCTYVSCRLVRYSRIILPTPPTDINAQWNWFIQDCAGYPWQTWSSAYFLQVPWNYLFFLAKIFCYSSSTSQSLDITFPNGRTDVLQVTYPWLPTKQWNISELRVLLPVLSTRPQQPCRTVWALCKKQQGILTCSFYKQRISTSWAMLLQAHISRFHINKKVFEISILYSGFQVNLQFSKIQSSHRTDKTACCVK